MFDTKARIFLLFLIINPRIKDQNTMYENDDDYNIILLEDLYNESLFEILYHNVPLEIIYDGNNKKKIVV
jgi:hypothetical protein